jgi:hypothetical protein
VSGDERIDFIPHLFCDISVLRTEILHRVSPLQMSKQFGFIGNPDQMMYIPQSNSIVNGILAMV